MTDSFSHESCPSSSGDEDDEDLRAQHSHGDSVPTAQPPLSYDMNNNDENRTNSWSALRLSQASYKDLGRPSEVEERFYRNCLEIPNARLALKQLLFQPFSSTSRDYSIQFRAYDFLHQDPVLGEFLLRYPATLLPILEKAVVRAQRFLLDELKQQEKEQHAIDDDHVQQLTAGSSVKGEFQSSSGTAATRVHARLIHLPASRFKASLSRLEAKDVGQIWQVCGTVVRASPVQMYESARTYQCKASNNNNKKKGGSGGCGRTFLVQANVQHYNNALTPPTSCPLSLDGGTKKCGGTNLVAVDSSKGSVHTDYQEIKIQESSSGTARMGQVPRSLLIKLQHDLVDLCQPGDQVVVVGSLLAQWQSDVASAPQQKKGDSSSRDAAEPEIGLALSAHSIVVLGDDRPTNGGESLTLDDNKKYRAEFEQYWRSKANRPIQARDYICQAVCPKLYGLSVIKLGLLLTLIGGVSADTYRSETNTMNGAVALDDRNGHNESFAADGEEEESPDRDRDSDEPQTHDLSPQNGSTDLFVLAPRPTQNTTQEPLGYGPYEGIARKHGIRQQEQQQQTNKEATTARPQKETSRTNNQTLFHSRSSSAQVQTRRRSQSHLLLVGDPGTGKSQFLRFAAALSPRAVMTTGVGTTSAGLTCAAVRHGASGEFALEAGALVLADQGVCCIDEFGCIREQDRTTIHEAMEQQHLSVAKAGIVCKLNCRATIVAVMNPRDCLYDNQTSLSMNTGLGTPLLSRFDLIFKLVDTSDAERDDNITSYLLDQATYKPPGGNIEIPENEKGLYRAESWPLEKLRAYVAIVKETFWPVLGDEAALLLKRHYEACRASHSKTIPVTVRFLESLIRLSQAHARLLYRDTVTLLDAVAVIRVMECSAFCYGGFDCPSSSDLDAHGNRYHESLYCDPMSMEYSEDPDLDMCCFEYRILHRYEMLGYMTDARRRQAEAELYVNSTKSQEHKTWADVEGHFPEQSTYQQDLFNTQTQSQVHYGGVPSSQPWQPHPHYQQVPSQPSQVQDHYGRIHYTPDPNMIVRHKRRRQH